MPRLFGDFEIDPEGYRLLCGGREVTLEPRAMDLLCYLAARPNRLIRKDELLTEVWNAQSLSDGVLSNTIGKLRQALGQDAKAVMPIETVRGRGYRWRVADEQHEDFPAAETQLGEPYIGRPAVLEMLSRALADAAGGKGQLLMLVGEPGIGKTRTLDELAQRAAAHSFKVYQGAAYDGAGAPAYWPWIEVLRAAHAQLGALAFNGLLPATANELPILIPELVAGGPTFARDQRALRFELFDELTCVLGALGPALIVLDDLHWADAASLELLAYAARALSKRPILLAAALREHELQANPSQAQALHKLERNATRIALTGLAEPEVSQLVASLPYTPALDARAHAALHRRTQGNPFFVRQMLALFEARSLVPDAASVEAVELPAAVHSVVQRRIAELDDGLRRTLAAAAVIGAEFEAGLLAELLEAGLDDTLNALDLALRAGVIERQSGVVRRFTFAHVLLREVLYDSLGLLAAGALHAKLARALQARAGARDPRLLGEIARHALRAVPCQLAACLQHCSDAADAARQASGFEAAAELLSCALDKSAAEGGDPSDACELLLALAFDQLCSSAQEAAAQTLERGVKLSLSIGRADLLAGFACRMADWLEFSGDQTLARLRIEQALAGISEDDSRSRVLLLGRAARLRPALSLDERQALFAHAESLANQVGEPELLIDLAFCRANVRDPSEAHSIGAAITHYHELYERFPSAHAGIRDDMRRLNVSLTAYLASATIGDFSRADAALVQLQAAAVRCQVPTVSSGIELITAGRMLAKGQLSELEANIQRQLENVSDGPPSGLQGGWFMYAWLLAHARGQLAPWAALEIQLENVLPTLRNTQHETFLRVWVAWLYAHTGRPNLAADAMRWLTHERLASKPVHYGDLGLLCQMADIVSAIKQYELASVLYTRLEPHADCHALGILGESWGSVALYLGMLAGLLEDEPLRLQQLKKAAAAHTRWRLPLALARTDALLTEGNRGERAPLADPRRLGLVYPPSK